MQKINIDEDERNANWLHSGRRVKRQPGSLGLSVEHKKGILAIINKHHGVIGENGQIIGCDVYSDMLEEISELGGLICYCSATGGLMIANWRMFR